MNQIYITSVAVKNFRCFTSQRFDFNSPVVVIEGTNGSGKTSLLEAIYYTCYMRSFRAHSPRDLIQFGQSSFFVITSFNEHDVSVGVMQQNQTIKRQIKIDQKTITSYRELHDYCRVITTTEDDLLIIKGGPEKRRSFIDHALFLTDIEMLETFKVYKEVLDNRNALLQKQLAYDDQQFLFWTEKLWNMSATIQQHRQNLLQHITQYALPILESFWPGQAITFEYQTKNMSLDQTIFGDFLHVSGQVNGMFSKEFYLKRSFFGAHLDEIEICVNGKKSRHFSSRGQQKLLVMVLKIALLQYLLTTQGRTAFLLDDFTTDFDHNVVEKLMDLCLSTSAQLIFVSPLYDGQEAVFLQKKNISFTKISL